MNTKYRTPELEEAIKASYKELKSSVKVALIYGCARSTIIYIVHPEVYERHKEHMRYMTSIKKGLVV